jgi:dTDP-4-dehydrorhamnose 3,5-epimerase
MERHDTGIDGVWTFVPRQHSDDRGTFLEFFRSEPLAEVTGHDLGVLQANCSVSSRGVLRGIHYADVPPSQAKYVTCVSGAVLDIIVDIRVGSPTFGQHVAVRLDDSERAAVYVSEGLGHSFMALSESATVIYLCSESYSPTREHGIHPLDTDLALPWPADIEPLLSPKDAAAPGLSEAAASGALPSWDECQAFYASLRQR